MIKEEHVMPQSLNDLLNSGLKLGVSLLKKLSIFFYVMVLVYFFLLHFVSSLFMEGSQLSTVFMSFASISFSLAATAYLMYFMMVTDEHSKKDQRKLVRRAFNKLIPSLIIGGTLIFVLSTLGSMLFILPGIILFIYFLFFPQVMALEEKKQVFKALKRSVRIVRGSFFVVAGVYCLFLAVQAITAIMIAFLIESSSFYVTAFISSFVHISLIPFQAAVLNLLYLERRSEREAFDYEVFTYEAKQRLKA
ncbi:hypothetical protein [Halalkalibacter krulwichiae]|uniref:Glycerophosphoryl diester phosphodiesterase membrane domain-containing protein n=1 Tax=Halalkalibacter krulwichiae TaxID=199441 RepID=A0A1X9MLX6_9BACI|nr:hypothetical protein [Halalkalibacter krulwichiae]ARK32002.1 hypothetical protein BkAM31D_20325 [Halalkalibacter krulwichiae]